MNELLMSCFKIYLSKAFQDRIVTSETVVRAILKRTYEVHSGRAWPAHWGNLKLDLGCTDDALLVDVITKLVREERIKIVKWNSGSRVSVSEHDLDVELYSGEFQIESTYKARELYESLSASPPSAVAAALNSVDVGIIIALPEEFEHFKVFFPKLIPVLHDGMYFYEFSTPGAGSDYQCVVTYLDAMGGIKAALVTERLISRYHPRTIVSLGLAGALDKDLYLGDLVAADSVDEYMYRTKAESRDGQTVVLHGGQSWSCSSGQLETVSNFKYAYAAQYQAWHQNAQRHLELVLNRPIYEKYKSARCITQAPKISRGQIASGPIVVASPEFAQWMKQKNRNFAAVEMETAGLMQALLSRGDSHYYSLVIRAISDFADQRKADLDATEHGVFREYAMRNATSLFISLCAIGALPRLQNHP